MSIGLWSSKQSPIAQTGPSRGITSDCQSIVKEIISPAVEAEKIAKKKSEVETLEKIYRIRTSIWNKIIRSEDFENFNDNEYFRYLAIYQDAKEDFSDINPVSIEQKMALIEVINGRLIPTSFNAEKNLSADVQKLNALKLKKLQNHMRSFDLSSKLTRDGLEDFAADLMFILKGPPASLLDYFTKSKTKRMNERLTRMVQEDILLVGLKGMLYRIPEKDSYSRLERGKYLVKRFFQHKMWKYLVLPYDLPWFERVKIPDELLEKIMVDGLAAHEEELITHLKKQDMIDHYERFRKVYRPVAFSLGFYFYYDKFNDKMQGKIGENQEEEKRQLLEDFKNLSDTIIETNETSLKGLDRLKEEQFERTLRLFREQNNSEPSPEELEEIRKKIFER